MGRDKRNWKIFKSNRMTYLTINDSFTRVKSIQFKILVCRFIIFTYTNGSEKI